MAKQQIVWSKEASDQLTEIYQYLLDKASIEIANRVTLEIFDVVENILNHPLKYEQDQYRRDNSGEFRALTIYHYRITYRVMKKQVEIIQVRHTSRKPKFFD